jgi:integrase
MGEALALKWHDIDFHNGILHVRHTVQRIKNTGEGAKTKVVNTQPKTQFSVRSIPMPQFLTDKLLPLKKAPDGYVLSVNGKQMEPRTYQYRFKKLLQRLGLPPLSFHNLRHTFCTRALELGFDVKTLADLAGHGNANITLRTYAHSLMEHKRAQMNLLGNLQK